MCPSGLCAFAFYSICSKAMTFHLFCWKTFRAEYLDLEKHFLNFTEKCSCLGPKRGRGDDRWVRKSCWPSIFMMEETVGVCNCIVLSWFRSERHVGVKDAKNHNPYCCTSASDKNKADLFLFYMMPRASVRKHDVKSISPSGWVWPFRQLQQSGSMTTRS